MTATVKEVKNTVDAVRNVNRDIRNYYWMANQINESEANNHISANTTEYSIQASLPKAPHTNSDPTYRSVQQRLREEERNERYLLQIKFLEDAVSALKDERERIVIEGSMDKMTLREVGVVLGISKQAVYEIKENAVQKLAVKMYLGNELA